MAPFLRHWARQLLHTPLPILVLLCVVGTACSTTDKNIRILFEDPRGTVSLQAMADQSIQATHPITLDPVLIAQILRGMEVQDQERGIQKLLIGPPPPVPVFSDDQIQFLAPLLAEGLRTAAPDQRIGYRVQTTHKGTFLESSTTETTAGSLYAYGRQLYVKLSQYRYSPVKTNLILMGDMSHRSPLHDTSGLKNRILLFTPSTAQRPDAFDTPDKEKPTDKILAIDYQMLQEAPAAASVEGLTPQMRSTAPVRETLPGAGPPEAPTHSTEALAQEVETLRKELKSVQQQLGNQPTKQDSSKPKTTPQKK